MKKSNFEQQIAQIKLKQASNNYQAKANQLLQELKIQKQLFKWSYVWAFALLLSIGINVYQYSFKALPAQKDLMVDNNHAQNNRPSYSIVQGAIVPYSGNNDITLIFEN